jgi:hypothetical protein
MCGMKRKEGRKKMGEGQLKKIVLDAGVLGGTDIAKIT